MRNHRLFAVLIAVAPLVFLACKSAEESAEDAWVKSVKQHVAQVTQILREGGLESEANLFSQNANIKIQEFLDPQKRIIFGHEIPKEQVRIDLIGQFKLFLMSAEKKSEKMITRVNPISGKTSLVENYNVKGLSDNTIAAYKKATDYIKDTALPAIDVSQPKQ